MSRRELKSSLDKIRRLASRPHDVATFFAAAGDVLHEAVPSAMEDQNLPYWYTVDPDSLLITSVVGDCDLSVAELMRFEYLDDDVNKVSEVLDHHRGIQTLHEVTDGDPSRSRAFRDYSWPLGIGHEVLVALRSREGRNWGAVRLVRGRGGPGFSRQEREFLRSASRWLAAGIRRGLLIGESRDPESQAAPGMLVVAEDLTVSSITPAAERLLADFEDWSPGRELPVPVLTVVSRIAHDPSTADAVELRVHARSGWMTLHAAALSGAYGGAVGVIVERAHPARIAPLLMELYELTPRERDVISLVIQGLSTTTIAATLFLSADTVQQHVKNVFGKTGTRSRKELVSAVFYDAYDPRVNDNDERQLIGLPIRGGPLVRNGDKALADSHLHRTPPGYRGSNGDHAGERAWRDRDQRGGTALPR